MSHYVVDHHGHKRDRETGVRLTDCCGAFSTFHDEVLCCKVCWREVSRGQGDRVPLTYSEDMGEEAYGEYLRQLHARGEI